MASQYKAPQVTINPVQNIGGGIAQGVGNIVNVLLQRKQQENQMQMLDQMLQQQQQQNEAAAMNMAPIAEQLGLPLATVNSMDASTLNKLLEAKQEEAKFNGQLNTLTELELFNQLGGTPEAQQLLALHKQDPLSFPLSAFTTPQQQNNAMQSAYAAMGKTLPGTQGLGDIQSGNFKQQYMNGSGIPSSSLNNGTLSPEARTQFGLRGITAYDAQDKSLKDTQEVSGLQGIQQGQIGIQRGQLGLKSDALQLQALPTLLQQKVQSGGLANEAAAMNNSVLPALLNLKLQQGNAGLLGTQQNNFIRGSQIDYGQGILGGQYLPSDIARMQPGMSAMQGGNPLGVYNSLLQQNGNFKDPYKEDPNGYFRNYLPTQRSW